jgi:ATP-dependent DNA helicase 2 subunit 1
MWLTFYSLFVRETEKITQMVDGVTGEILKSSREKNTRSDRIRFYVEFGGTPVAITPHEISEIKKQSNISQEASLVLLGFKEMNAIPLHYTVDKSYFLYPQDEKVTGSTMAFANLHASMIRKGVMAIGELLTKVTATSRLIAMYPQVEETDESGLQVQPPGMVAVVLPFDDDVRALDEYTGEATKESVNAGMNLIEHMMFDKEFELDYFKNDSLAHFWHYIESIALETTLPEPEESLNMVSDEDVRDAAGKEIDAFYASLPEDIEKSKAVKKVKLAKDELVCNWLDLYMTDSLCNCNINELKNYLRSVGEKLVGKKADLIDRVAQSIGGRIANGELQKSKKIRKS